MTPVKIAIVEGSIPIKPLHPNRLVINLSPSIPAIL